MVFSYDFELSDFFQSIFVFVIGLSFVALWRRVFFLTRFEIYGLYIWHTFFCVIYSFFVLRYGGDAFVYYIKSLSGEGAFGFGTRAVVVITSFFSNQLSMGFYSISLVFGFVGFWGLAAFFASLKAVTWNKNRWVRYSSVTVSMLPSVSFWSSGVGKDSLSFCAMGLALWAALSLKRRWLLLAFAILLMLLVRPHMAGMLGLGLAGSFIFQRGIPLPQRVLLGGVALVVSFFLVPIGLNYAGVGENASAEDVMEYIEGRQGHNLKGGGAVDISGMSPPAQMFTYLFRPTLIEARNLFSLAAALDNTILLFLFIAGGWALIRKPLPAHLLAHNRMFLWIYSLGAWLVLAMTTANLGIALRQKWMFAPMLIFLLISVIGRSRAPIEQVAVLQSEGRG